MCSKLPLGVSFVDIVNKLLIELVPYENNPRNNKDAVEYVAESIKQFGFKVPLVIDKDNVIVCGHTRYLAAERLGMKELPCVIADDLTEEQINAYRLADNKVHEYSEWDFEMLQSELDGITEIDMGKFLFVPEDKKEQKEAKEKKSHNDKTIVCPKCGNEFNV